MYSTPSASRTFTNRSEAFIVAVFPVSVLGVLAARDFQIDQANIACMRHRQSKISFITSCIRFSHGKEIAPSTRLFVVHLPQFSCLTVET